LAKFKLHKHLRRYQSDLCYGYAQLNPSVKRSGEAVSGKTVVPIMHGICEVFGPGFGKIFILTSLKSFFLLSENVLFRNLERKRGNLRILGGWPADEHKVKHG